MPKSARLRLARIRRPAQSPDSPPASCLQVRRPGHSLRRRGTGCAVPGTSGSGRTASSRERSSVRKAICRMRTGRPAAPASRRRVATCSAACDRSTTVWRSVPETVLMVRTVPKRIAAKASGRTVPLARNCAVRDCFSDEHRVLTRSRSRSTILSRSVAGARSCPATILSTSHAFSPLAWAKDSRGEAYLAPISTWACANCAATARISGSGASPASGELYPGGESRSPGSCRIARRSAPSDASENPPRSRTGTR